jgi:hypothetical protein
MARADFVFFSIDEELSGAFVADQTAVKEFVIDGKPVGQGYILIQTFDVQLAGHSILINGKNLPDWDLPKHPAREVWQTWMDRIPAGVLKQGKNTIQITKQPGFDKFEIRGISINWREEG